jgi:predicted MFS family arabinose efflux permease
MPLLLLSAAAFVSAGSMRVIDPVLHLIATDFGATVAEASILIAAFALPYGVMQIAFGPLGDRYGKLPVMCLALVAFGCASALSATATSLTGLEILRGATGMAAAGIIPLCLAYIGDHTDYSVRQATIAQFLTGIVLAQVLAAPLGGIIGEVFGWRPLFVGTGAVALLAAALLWRARKTAPERLGAGGRLSLRPYAVVLSRPAGRFIVLAALVDGAVLFGPTPFLGAFLHEVHGLSYGEVGLVLALIGVSGFAYTRLATRLVAALGERGLVSIGGGVIAASFATMGLVPSWPWAAALIGLLGGAFFMLHGTLQARATEAAPEARGTAVALFAMALFLGQSLGALAIGTAIGLGGYAAGFSLAAAGVAALTLVLRARL